MYNKASIIRNRERFKSVFKNWLLNINIGVIITQNVSINHHRVI